MAKLKWLALLTITPVVAQTPPPSSGEPWHSFEERRIVRETRGSYVQSVRIEPDKIYSLGDLVDFAETHNPETRVAWENARAQAAALGIAKSELFPTIASVALTSLERKETGVGSRFYRQTIADFEISLEFTYTIFDFGARRGRINAESARLLTSNFSFNDVHRALIYNVSQAYYRVLNAAGQEEAAGANLVNAQAVQQAAEERLRNGLATLPDVLEARSATAQAQYDLQAVLGAEQIARGDLATLLGMAAATQIRVQPINELPAPDALSDTAEAAIHRALEQRPDLQAQAADIRVAQAERQQARSALYPALNATAGPSVVSPFMLQQTLPWGHTTGLGGVASLNLSWTVFDGGARRNRIALSEARIREGKARVAATRDQIEDQVWAAYSNLNTAFRQREAATALLAASMQSYSAALESYNYGLRNLLDVTNAQKVLAQARTTDILARTQVLAALADLAFRTGDAIQSRRTEP
jgi:outer membrane protein